MNTSHSLLSLRSNAACALRICVCSLAAALAAPGMAADRFNSDRPGGTDHPLLSRYQDSILYMYGDESPGRAKVVVEEKGKPVLRQLEGRVSNRMYWAPNGASPLNVFRNYKQALMAAGFQLVYACESSKCETDSARSLARDISRIAAWKFDDAYANGSFDDNSLPRFHFLSARRAGAAGDTHVNLALESGYTGKPMEGRTVQFVQIVEPVQVELGKVTVATVDAKGIQGGLKRDGKIALYGVTFDTNKAVLGKQSDIQLSEMADALKAAPELKVFIVGHTDNQGEFQTNTILSQQRADAVVSALVGRYGIAQVRLAGRGVANLAPVASNESEQGRAQNRRVEMVVR